MDARNPIPVWGWNVPGAQQQAQPLRQAQHQTAAPAVPATPPTPHMADTAQAAQQALAARYGQNRPDFASMIAAIKARMAGGTPMPAMPAMPAQVPPQAGQYMQGPMLAPIQAALARRNQTV